MALLGREVINALLVGPAADGRLVHDSPVRGDVWASFASDPAGRVDMLIESFWDRSSSVVAARLANRLYDSPRGIIESHQGYGISYVDGFVTAKLSLDDLIRAVIPFTRWARDVRFWLRPEEAARLVEEQVKAQLEEMHFPTERREVRLGGDPRIARIVPTYRILGALVWAAQSSDAPIQTLQGFFEAVSPSKIARLAGDLVGAILHRSLEAEERAPGEHGSADIFAVSRNRPIELAIERSVPSIKADAATTLFSISCKPIAWAVLDTGIDGSHPAFKDVDKPGKNRIVATYDFTRLRKVVLIDHLYNKALLHTNARELGQSIGDHGLKRITDDLLKLANDAQEERAIDWAIAERYVQMANPPTPISPHGTHVAGIIGGCWNAGDYAPGSAPVAKRGVCPDIRLYDFRVVSGSEEDSEFALVGALQFIRYLNARNNFLQIHGANISLSIRHDVRNYACGRTPVCSEAVRLVNAGVVVVAAAGNRGYQSYNLTDGSAFETYAPSSITDPGNAEEVITVGATHRSEPFTYGISFFSSRGPTGDGRAKPDLVAPGEKIWSVVPGNAEDALSGTSMAAPHVSGAAAMLMARNSEFIGESAEIKRILCRSCTDLGRERTFQGAGMLDILRAMQSI